MNVSNKTTPFLLLVCLFLSLLNGYGQDVLPKEQEREIKTSGKYYFSECSAFDEVDAKECALMDLTQLVLIEMIKQAIQSDEVEMKNAMEMRAQTARLNLAGKIRILAWIEKGKVQMGTEPTQALATTIVPAQTSTPEITLATNPIQELEPTPVSTSSSTAISMLSEPEPSLKPNITIITNPVIRDLVTCATFDQFRRMADGFRRQGKIVYGTNKASFVNLANCLVAVFTTEQKLIALLDAGQDSRMDFLTGKTIQNIEQQFTGNILYWIQIIN